jgi:hypothetical protein
MRLALLVVLAAALLAPAAAEARTKRFHTPSKNIACLYSSEGGPGPFLRCDLYTLNDTAFTVRRRGKARRIHVTDAVGGGGRELGYGERIRVGPFRCLSRRVGLRCRSVVSGHGFFISRDEQRLF